MAKSDSKTTTPAQRRRQRWGKNLGEALRQRDLTARQFHRLMLDAGADVSMQAVYLWLSGEIAPTPENQGVIAEVLDAQAHDLFPVSAVSQ